MKSVVILSGGASGLGLELVRKLHSECYYVCNIANEQ